MPPNPTSRLATGTVKDNPTAYDLLLAYAECVEEYSKPFDKRQMETVLRRHGWKGGYVPLQWMNDLRRRALDAAKAERGDE